MLTGHGKRKNDDLYKHTEKVTVKKAEKKVEILRTSGENGHEPIDEEDFKVYLSTEDYNEVCRRGRGSAVESGLIADVIHKRKELKIIVGLLKCFLLQLGKLHKNCFFWLYCLLLIRFTPLVCHWEGKTIV